MADQPLVGIIMGSKSDMPTMEACMGQLDELGVPYELVIASAHRTPDKVHEWAATAADRGLKVIIAAAGKAARANGKRRRARRGKNLRPHYGKPLFFRLHRTKMCIPLHKFQNVCALARNMRYSIALRIRRDVRSQNVKANPQTRLHEG